MNRKFEKEILISPSSPLAAENETETSKSSAIQDETSSHSTTTEDSKNVNDNTAGNIKQNKESTNERDENKYKLLKDNTSSSEDLILVNDENAENRRSGHENQFPKKTLPVVDYQAPTTSMMDKESKRVCNQQQLSKKEKIIRKHKKISPKSSSVEYSDISCDEIVSSTYSDERDDSVIISSTPKQGNDPESEEDQPAKKVCCYSKSVIYFILI